MREKAAIAVASLLALFTLATAALGQMEAMLHRSTFLALTVWLGVLIYPLGKGKPWRPAGVAVDILIVLVATVATLYIHINYEDLMMNLPEANLYDVALASGMVLVLLEMSRRTVGLIFPCLILAGIAYSLFGNLIKGPLGHRGFDIYFITETIFMGDLGIWGLLLGVAATTIAAFVLFGSVLLHTGGGKSFMDVAMLVSGRSPGGAAKIATVASGLFGMVSGSAVANVATTGNFTIPMMRRLGYPPALAGAVEAVASTGGQIAPPIMGAGAFIMAEIIGMDYWRIALAATIPGLVYYFAVFMSIHYYAKRHRLGYVPDDQLPTLRDVLHFDRLTPVAAGLLGLAAGIALGKSVQMTAFYAITGMALTFLGICLAKKRLWGGVKQLGEGLVDAGRGMVVICILLAGAQVLVALINLTGVGVSMSSIIASMAGSHIFILAPIAATVCLILGMGLPTTAAYVLVACVMGPAMTKLGLDPLTAHMFIFYYATLSVITPPVCTAVFVAAGISQAPWLQVARYAVMLAGVTYVLPVLFVVYPGMLFNGSWVEIVEAALSAAIFALACASIFGARPVSGNRLADATIFAVVAVLALIESWYALTPAIGITLAVYWLEHRRQPQPSPEFST